jgi:hypothetical protein
MFVHYSLPSTCNDFSRAAHNLLLCFPIHTILKGFSIENPLHFPAQLLTPVFSNSKHIFSLLKRVLPMRKTRLGLNYVCAVGFSFFFLHAISFSQEATLTLSQLAQRSEVVVSGKVTSVQSKWNNARTKIVTSVNIMIAEQFKGSPGQTSLTIVTLGGEVNGIGESYSHMPKFTRDEQVVVFATRDRAGQYRVTGGDQGKFTIKQDANSNAKLVGDRIPLDVFRSDLKLALRNESVK